VAINDVFRLTIKQTYLGSNVNNVFGYRQIADGTAPFPSNELINTFATNVWGDAVAIQNLGVQTVLYDSLNLNNLADYSTLVSNADGLRPGEGLPSFVSWSYLLKRAIITIRNGRKAIAGVSEPDQSNGQPDAGITTLLDALATVMALQLTGADGTVFQPVIYRRPILPLPLIPFNIDVAGVDFQRISTQSTRKL